MINAPRFALLDVNGVDAASFLHSQLACEVRELAHGQWRFACYCEADGRVQALIVLARLSDSQFHLLLPADLADAVRTRLLRYRLRARCNIELHSVSLISGRGQYVIAGPAFEACWQAAEADTATTEPELWNRQLALGQAWVCAATSGKFLPQMLGYAEIGAFSLRKGCFPGQEIVARTHYLGRSKRRLVHATAAEANVYAEAGSEWIDPALSGVSAVLLGTRCDGSAALLVAPDSMAVGTRLQCADAAAGAGFVIDRDYSETKRDAGLNGGSYAVVSA